MNFTKTRSSSEALGSASAASESFKRQKVTETTGPLGVAWFQKQDAAFLQATDGTMALKLGMHQFGNFPDRNDFARDWCQEFRQEGHAVYELLLDGPCRLYFDIEAEYDEKPTDSENKAWLADLLATIKTALHEGAGVSDNAILDDVLVGSDCRLKSDGSGYKRSFHLVFSNIVFRNNHTAMKTFVVDCVMPRVKTKTQFKWISVQKNGDVVKYAIDPLVYTKNRAWRLMYARKKGKTAMTPWDTVAWQEITYVSDRAREDWFERSLCGQADTEDLDGTIIETTKASATSGPPKVPGGETTIPAPAVVSPYATTPQLDPGTKAQREFAIQACVFLATWRKIDVNAWMKAGWALATIFGKDADGLLVFHQFSQGVANYDKQHCDKIYKGGHSRIGIGSLITWLKEDNEVVANLLLPQLNAQPSVDVDALVAADVALNTAVDAPGGTGDAEGGNAAGEPLPPRENRVNLKMVHRKIEDFNLGKLGNTTAAQLQAWVVRYMNQYFCLVNKTSGAPMVLEEFTRPEMKFRQSFDQHATVDVSHFILKSQKDLQAAYRKYTQKLGAEKGVRAKNIIARWLDHPDCRTHDKVGFDPKSVGNGANDFDFNMFRGLAIPSPPQASEDEEISVEHKDHWRAQAKIVTDHILTIWSKGDQNVLQYYLDWMAHLVQRPGVKMNVALVLKGGQGSGKGIIVQMLGEILGLMHFMSTTNVDEVTGQFQTEKMMTNLLMFLDECTFAGDKKQASQLKGLITEAWRKWEAKYVNAVQLPNVSNYIVASNYDQIVLVENDNRRYFMNEVSNKYAGRQTDESAAYFNKLASVDPRHFARFLYERDISNFNPKAWPSTDYHRFQKVLNLPAVDSTLAWVHDLLRDAGGSNEFGQQTLRLHAREETALSKDAVFCSYKDYCRNTSGSGVSARFLDSNSFFKKLYDVFPDLKDTRPGRLGQQVRCITFPDLADCRALFLVKMNEEKWDWSRS
jgi:hypothetical protein